MRTPFKLYDTYGFPVDLTVEILEEQGFKLAREAFEEMMRAQRERARQARGNTVGLGWAGDDVSPQGAACHCVHRL